MTHRNDVQAAGVAVRPTPSRGAQAAVLQQLLFYRWGFDF